MIFFNFFIAVHISGCDSGACVCCASFECVGMCKYDDASVLFYACWFARRQMHWSSLQGFVRTAGCSLRRLGLPEVGLLHLHLYHVLTDDACADALWISYLFIFFNFIIIIIIIFFYYYFFYFFSVIFHHVDFMVRKFTVISIASIQYCLAHLNKLISVI